MVVHALVLDKTDGTRNVRTIFHYCEEITHIGGKASPKQKALPFESGCCLGNTNASGGKALPKCYLLNGAATKPQKKQFSKLRPKQQ